MRNQWKNLGRIATLVACCWFVSLSNPAGAQEGNLVLPEPDVADEAPAAVEEPAEMPATEPMAQPSAVCRPDIKYRTHLSARRAFRCSGEKEVLMIAENPADCCLYEIPLCIPCCCEGAPAVSSRCGAFGRGIVEYCWDCGITAEVVFRARGDVKVHYR